MLKCSLNNRIDVNRRGLSFHSVILDNKLVDIRLAAIILVVGLVIVPANTVVDEIVALPAAFRVVIDGDVDQRLVLFSEPVTNAAVDQAALLIDTG